MEISNTALRMLEYMGRPGFMVRNAVVAYVNADAAKYHIHPGTPLQQLLGESMAQYDQFSEGCMRLSITVNELPYPVTVERLEDFDLFLLEREDHTAQFRVLAMASQQLRVPLTGLMNTVGEDNPTVNRSLHQLHRVVSNMSDAMRYRIHRKPKLQTTELRGYMAALMESVIARSEQLPVNITYCGLSEPLYCLIDDELLERAVLNLISNSVKAGSHQIDVTLQLCNSVLTLTVTDDGRSVPTPLYSNMFEHFDREPGIGDAGYGLGLGMMMVQAAATAHKGTVLMQRPQEGGLRVTVTLSVMKGDSVMRAPIMMPDYLGGRDHVLTELSDILPEDIY